MEISQSASLENWGSLLFIILTIDFSSLSSSSSSLLLCATVCAERNGETIVLADDTCDGDCDGVGDGDLDGRFILVSEGDGDLDLDEVAFVLILDLMLVYLDGSFRCLDCVGRFQ